MHYTYAAASNQLHGSSDILTAHFSTFITNPWRLILWSVLVLLVSHIVVARGVVKGMERASQILMPVLLIELIALIGIGLSLPGNDSSLSMKRVSRS